ncbi:LCP family protein [Streptomyces sp. NPDC051976]|uniref:LCP family protein n=1 Tax=Streptomyces sp. NPDC051976 TaxID=3154947 RepID=UPI00341CD81C
MAEDEAEPEEPGQAAEPEEAAELDQPERPDEPDEPDQPEGRGRAAVRRWGGRRVMRLGALTLSGLVLLVAAVGTVIFLRLNGNIRDLPLFGGIGGDAGKEQPDAFGRTPVNVLVIGSDTRADPADCHLGGACGPGENADVEMVLHISADRTHATALSIPRDTVTELPACRKPHGGVSPATRGQVNSTLRFGPGCTVAAVHALTRIPIDHFVMADFAGVVRMSDAVGGVPVCVDRDVYDSYSHLKLARGRHALKGTAALQFLRSRHGFGDGSDIGRTDAQHLFLAALALRMRQSGSLTDPASLLDVADAATRALTVDPGLASVSKLVGLAKDLRKVPSARLSFTTAPTRPDPGDPNRVVVTETGQRLFAAIAADMPLTVTGAPAGDDKPADPTNAPATHTRGRTAATGSGCAKVATTRSVRVRGVAMTPSAAFRATPRIPVSAR